MSARNQMLGFSLFEIILVVAILAILAGIGFAHYGNFQKNIELDSTLATLVSDLRTARSLAMSGEQARKWGVHLVNGTSDYYEIFSTTSSYASGTVATTAYLPNTILFANPIESANKDIIFNAITGATTADSAALAFEDRTVTITVTADGTIY